MTENKRLLTDEAMKDFTSTLRDHMSICTSDGDVDYHCQKVVDKLNFVLNDFNLMEHMD